MEQSENLTEEDWNAIAESGFLDWPPEALARLALSYAARELSDSARSLVATSSDEYVHSGEMVDTAARLVAAAENVLQRAVIYERERGRSWEVVGDALGVKRQTAHERFSGAIETWETALDRPCEPVVGSKLLTSNLPEGLSRPTETANELDEWVISHVQPWEAVAGKEHPVSDNLIDGDRLTFALSRAVTSAASRVSNLHRSNGSVDPIAERMFWERKVRLYERLAVEDPAGYGATAEEIAAEARAKVQELKEANGG